jgi:hypothetical protein
MMRPALFGGDSVQQYLVKLDERIVAQASFVTRYLLRFRTLWTRSRLGRVLTTPRSGCRRRPQRLRLSRSRRTRLRSKGTGTGTESDVMRNDMYGVLDYYAYEQKLDESFKGDKTS